MSYQDKYQEYLNQIPKDIEVCYETGKRHVLAYTSNCDVILVWNIHVYNKILKKFLNEEPSFKDGDTIDTMEDFARITSYYLMQGIGGNFDITNLQVCQYLKEHFTSEVALGGTCAQAAAALGTLGFPVNVHLTDVSEEVCKLMNMDGMSVISEGQIVPIMNQVSKEPPVYHFVLQFSKDDKMIVRGKEVEIPLSNRLIMFYDTVHKEVPVEEQFLEYWNSHADRMYSYLVSGFDAIIDLEVMKMRITKLEEHFKKMRLQNPGFVFYFEGAFYMNPKIKELANDMIGKYADILGMNEEELIAQVGRFGKIIDVNSLQAVIEGVEMILSKYSVKGVILHTKDYSMYCGKKLEGIDIEKGLTMGNLLSGTRARIGKYGTLEECGTSLKLLLSEVGLRFAREIKHIKTGKEVCIVPSRYLEHPKYTIGLGDTFVAGVHTCFIK